MMQLIDFLDQAEVGDNFSIWSDEGIMMINYKGLEYVDEDVDLESEVVKHVIIPEKNLYIIFLKGYGEWYSGMMDELKWEDMVG